MANPIELRAVDSATYSSVSSATFTVNGSFVSSVDGVALVPFETRNRSYVIVASAPGYKTRTEVLPPGSTTLTLSFPLEPIEEVAGAVTVRTNPAVPNANVTLTGPQTATGVTDSDGEVEFDGLDAGDYQVSVDAPGYQMRSPGESVTVNPDQPVDVAMVQTTPSPGTSLIVPTSTTTAPAAVSTSPFVFSPRGYEDIPYGQDLSGKYFTASQCRLYINDIFIDELVSFQFVNQANHQPLFSYASRFVSAYAKGRALVQGQISINYVHDKYLYAVLAEGRPQVNSNIRFSIPEEETDSKNTQELARLLQQEKALKALPRTSENQDALQRTQETLGSFLEAVSPRVIDDAKELVKSAETSEARSFSNVCYLPGVFQMRLVVGFDGVPTKREFEACKLISNEMIVDQKSGESLYESYGFIARRVK